MYQLIGAEISYYTGKLRAYLRHADLPFKDNVNPLKAKKLVGKQIIPVLITPDGDILQDSTEICDRLEKQLDNPFTPTTPKQQITSLLFDIWGTEHLTALGLWTRWHYDIDKRPADFAGAAYPWLPMFMKRWIGNRMSKAFSGALVSMGAGPEMNTALRKQFETIFYTLEEHAKHHDYLLGSKPCMGDFGLNAPAYAHWVIDYTSGDWIQENTPSARAFIINTQQPQKIGVGEYLPNDEIPSTLDPLIKMIASECIPAMKSVANLVEASVHDNPDRQYIKRYVGSHSVKMAEKDTTAVAFSHSLWCYQRLVDTYNAMSTEDKKTVDAWWAQYSDESIVGEIPQRVERKNHRLVTA